MQRLWRSQILNGNHATTVDNPLPRHAVSFGESAERPAHGLRRARRGCNCRDLLIGRDAPARDLFYYIVHSAVKVRLPCHTKQRSQLLNAVRTYFGRNWPAPRLRPPDGGGAKQESGAVPTPAAPSARKAGGRKFLHPDPLPFCPPTGRKEVLRRGGITLYHYWHKISIQRKRLLIYQI